MRTMAGAVVDPGDGNMQAARDLDISLVHDEGEGIECFGKPSSGALARENSVLDSPSSSRWIGATRRPEIRPMCRRLSP